LLKLPWCTFGLLTLMCEIGEIVGVHPILAGVAALAADVDWRLGLSINETRVLKNMASVRKIVAISQREEDVTTHGVSISSQKWNE